MKLTKEEQVTVNSYNKTAKEWSDAHSGKGQWGTELRVFKNRLPKGKILEIGCGGGRDAKRLIAKGYKYVGVDIAEAFVTVAKENVPEGQFYVRNVYDLGFPENSFDGFWCSATLLHVPKKRINKALSEIKKVTKKGGIGFISVKKGDREVLLEEESSDGNRYVRLWSFYSFDEFKNILIANGFEILHTRIQPVTERTTWLIYFVKVEK